MSKQFDFIGSMFSATNRKNMPPRFPRDSPATIRQPTVHVPCTRPDCVLPGCANLKLQTMNNNTRKTKMHGNGPKSRWGYVFPEKFWRYHPFIVLIRLIMNCALTILCAWKSSCFEGIHESYYYWFYSKNTIMLVYLSSPHPNIDSIFNL